jgi:hypothetical protein
MPLLVHVKRTLEAMTANTPDTEKWALLGRMSEVLTEISELTDPRPSNNLLDQGAVKFWNTHFEEVASSCLPVGCAEVLARVVHVLILVSVCFPIVVRLYSIAGFRVCTSATVSRHSQHVVRGLE